MALTRATDKIIANPDGNLNLSGIVTASSFIGSGSGLTGVASTDHIKTSTVANFSGGIQVGGATTLTGALTGTTGTFSSNVSITGNLGIGGTLTYEDVTNVDAVGVITARNGIQVSSGSSIGIGTDKPSASLYVHESNIPQGFTPHTDTAICAESSTNANIEIATGHNSTGALYFSDTGAVGKGKIAYLHGSGGDLMTFQTNGAERLRIHADGQISINSPNTPEAQVDIYQSGQSSTTLSMLIGANEGGAGGQGRTNSNAKAARIGCPHYTNAEESLNIVTAYSGATTNNLYWGGGTGVMNSATSHHFYTAANNTTTGGTERLRIDSSGHLLHGVTADEDTSGNGGLRFINTGDIQIDGDQKALVFRSTNSTAQIQSGIEWWNENGAGVQAKILCDRTATTKAPSDLVFYTNTDVDTSANNSEGDITEQLRIKSDGNSAFAGSITAQNYASRNLIINGDCSVCQYRGITGETTGVGILTTDRWKLEYAGHDEEITQEHRNNPVTDAPSKLGISHSFQVKNGNQTSTGSSDYARITHTIESQYMRNSGWDFQNPNSYLTLSFWCKSTVSKNFYGQFFCQDSPFKQRSFETGTLTANTWTKVEVTIPGTSGMNFDHNEGPGFIITWYLYAPTSYTSGNGALNTWTGFNATTRVPPDSDAWWTADNATFDITGVQLEVGSTATNFEIKNYDQNLWECKRYYQRSTDQSRGSNYSLQSSTWHSADGVQSFNKHNAYYDFKQNFEREMRVAPTLTIYGSSNQGDIHLESVAVGSKQVDWNNNTTEVKTKGFLLRHIEDQSDGNYTSGSGNAFGILAYTLDAEF